MSSSTLQVISGSDLMIDGIYYYKPDMNQVQKIVAQFLTAAKAGLPEGGNPVSSN